MSRTKGPNSFENFFSEPQDYPDYYVTVAHGNLEQTARWLTDYYMSEWEWITAENKKYLLYTIRDSLANAWTKWHGFIDDDGQLHNGWVVYQEYKGNMPKYRHVYTYSIDRHLIEHGHEHQYVLDEYGYRKYGGWNRSECLICGQLKMAKVQGALDEAIKAKEVAFNHRMDSGHEVALVLAARVKDLNEEIGYYDSYK